VFKSARPPCQQVHFKPAMSNPNGLPSKKNVTILTRAAL